MTVRGIPIQNLDMMPRFIKEHQIEIAALTIPKTRAPEVVEILVKSGVRGIWNFAHTDLKVPEGVIVENVHLSESLMRLSYNLVNMEQK